MDQDITRSDKILDLHRDLPPREGNKKNSLEEICKSKGVPFLRSGDQSLSHDEFPGLSGSGHNSGPLSESASDFWAQGIASRKVLDIRSNGNKRLGDSTTLMRESGNCPAESITARSAPIHSSDQLHGSRIPSFLEQGSTPATSFRVNHEARQVLKSSDSMSNENSDRGNKPLGPPVEDPVTDQALNVVEPDQMSELEAKKCCSTASASVLKPLTDSRNGNEDTPFRGADTVPLHAEDARRTVTKPSKSEDNLRVRLAVGKSKPAIAMIPGLNRQASSRLSPPKQQQNPEKPSKPSHAPQHNVTSRTKASIHLSKPYPIAPITPNQPIKDRASFKNRQRRNYFHGSAMRKSPQPSAQHARQRSMGRASIPNALCDFGDPGAPLGPSLGQHYPGPQQHTPEGQGQYFDIQGSMPPYVTTHFSGSLSPFIPSFPYSVVSSNNDAIDQNAQVYKQGEQNPEYSQSNHFDSYASSQAANAAPNAADLHQNGTMYTTDTNGFGARFYQNHTDPAHQLNQNLYSPLEPHREPSKPNQRTAKDLFIPEDLRLKLHARTEATLRVFAVMNTPVVEHFHTLTPLTSVSQQHNQIWHGHSSTTYKAVSAKDGRTYCLRRIHDFRATNINENTIHAVRGTWTAVRNSSVVSLHTAFTTTSFDDSSLIVVSDYHPDSKTVAEKHFSQTHGRSNRNTPPLISEHILWSYIVQITNAIKAVHSVKLAVRVIEPTKVIVTDENRIRLNGCALEDLLDSEVHDVADLQRLDFHKFGNFILALGTNNLPDSSRARAPDVFAQNYYRTNPQLRVVVEWLLGHDRPENNEGFDVLIRLISSNTIDAFDYSLRMNDQLYFSLNKEIDNSRIVRLLTKLSCLNERPEYEHDRTYSAQGPRAVLGLFRDHVFHQVNAQANPTIDMGHIMSCLNKLDAGIEERISLTSRDEQSVIVVSYKELKGALEGTWQELMRRSAG